MAGQLDAKKLGHKQNLFPTPSGRRFSEIHATIATVNGSGYDDAMEEEEELVDKILINRMETVLYRQSFQYIVAPACYVYKMVTQDLLFKRKNV